MYFIGLDAGSVTTKVVVLDKKGNKVEGHYLRHFGHPVRSSLNLLKDIKKRYPVSSLSVTGSGGRIIGAALNIKPLNEIVSQSYSVRKLSPHIRTIIELGGEDSKLIILEGGKIKDFSMNSVCAAGTGSFLEQQAERLRLSIEEFSQIASQSMRPSKIAGRCSVFAKSDMIHLQQIATPMEDIVSGLCFAVARNFKGTIAKGREVRLPVAFQGGVAANKGMVRAFREVFELGDLFVPPDFALMGAMGAALKDMDEGRTHEYDLEKLEGFLSSLRFSEQGHELLINEGDDFFKRHSSGNNELLKRQNDASRRKAYLGIDIGSISTNLAVTDEEGTLLAKRYLMTAGRPIEAVRQGLSEIYTEIGEAVDIAGVGTTGSGRYMIADYVGADIVKNEITAQATAAIMINPAVTTIFEIGGQDSKYISLKDGVIIDFEMNKACAAGTGSFIEEQAEKLQISVKDEFAASAFRSENPCRLGERCTVFMENSLMANLQKGANRDDLLAGLAYSIVQNYINRVVAGKPIGETIFFQGGVAFNKAVVAAFEKYLGRKITVPPHHDVTGAIGMALIAMRHMKEKGDPASSFKGFELSRKAYEISSFECNGCPNVCEINRVKVHGEKGFLFFGGRCEKYDVRRSRKASLPDPFAFREEMLWREHLKREAAAAAPSAGSKLTIGLPYIFFFHDFLPFWTTFLWELGFKVIVSPRTNRQVITLGLENVLSEACFPVKVAHGHIQYLKDASVDALFIPSFINVNQDGDEFVKGLACPHTQTIPYVSRAAISGMETITPVIDLGRGTVHLRKELHNALKKYGIRKGAVDSALRAAQSAQDLYRRAIKDKGREIIELTGSQKTSVQRPLVVIVGRAYNSYDPVVNLEIPKKLSNLEVLSIPMDFLLLRSERLLESWPNMYWRSGQRILKAARIIRNTPNLYALYIGNFSCGPDSFILKYFKVEMEGKPFLHIEIDEHSADAGAMTRCEAFLDSIEQQNAGGRKRGVLSQAVRGEVAVVRNNAVPGLKKRTVFIPYMADHAFAIKAAFEYCGTPAEVLPESDKGSVEIGKRYVSGKECYPYLITAGDMLKRVFSSSFNPGESAFFMPSGTGPCRFGQYNVSHRLILEKIGLKDVPIFAPNQDVQFYKELGIIGNDFTMKAWKGIVAYALLTKCLHETRPYEKSAGDAEGLYGIYKEKIYKGLIGRNGDMEGVLRELKRDFLSLPRTRDKKPLIGVIGEIFVRSHRFSNENLIKKIESLGGEVWLAPLEEWIYYVNSMAMRKALIKKDGSAMMSIFLTRFFQKRIEHKCAKSFSDFLRTLREPETERILEKATKYVHDSFEGETILSVGKAIDLIEKGAAGIVNAMPFGCMPGTIVTALLKVVNKDYGVPCISVPYDGTESATTELHLEAFMETVGANFK